ncbi:hypothetical protein Tco_0119662 [Tanacetum coccineum]
MTPYTLTESLVRSQLQLHDEGGIMDMPIPDIFLGMDNLGYPTEGKLTFHKNKFSPQWRFLIHTLLHCLSTKSGSWDQFGTPLAIALICLCEGKKYNWSRYIFQGRPTPTIPAAQMNEPDSKPPRPTPPSQMNQPGPTSDPHVESSSKDNDDDPLGGSFFASPSRSTASLNSSL